MIFSESNFPRYLLILLVFLAASPHLSVKAQDPLLPPWQEAQSELARGNDEAALKLLRICSFSGENAVEAEVLLRRILASQTAELLPLVIEKKLEGEQLDRFLNIYEEICSLRQSQADDWKRLLQAANLQPDHARLVAVGEKFLDRMRAGLAVDFDSDWVEPLLRLSAEFKNEWQIIYRWQVNKILAGLPDTAGQFKTEFENTGILAQTRAKSVLGLAEVAIAIGDLEGARRHLDQVRFFNKEFPDLDKMYLRLKKAGEIQRFIELAQQALQKRDFNAAENHCNAALKLDENNVFARNLLKNIEEARGLKPGGTLSAADQVALKLRRLESDLKKAQKNEDLLQMRVLLKEILIYNLTAANVKKLEEIENEIAASRVYAEERFLEAEKLFQSGEYEKLRLFLNRNPGMMSSVDRMVQIWEMKLMVNYYAGAIGPIELHNSARNILLKGGRSFFANFVLMKLSLAENRMDKAREYYKAAAEINPDFPGLRWPGWLLWAHGEGRFVVVIVLIVVLVFLIKLIRPVFAWYESTYWTRISILAAIFPSLAMRSLEKCFGSVRETYERKQFFRLLIKCCEKTGNFNKGIKFAENLLEISRDDEAAIGIIGHGLLRQQEVSPDKLPMLLKFALNKKDRPDVIEKTGKVIKKLNQVKPDQLDFLRIYVQKFPEDKDMFALIGRSLLEIPASELPDGAVAMLETAWKATDSDELWWNLWRSLMYNGKFELAIHLTEEAMNRGKPIAADKLLEVYDRELMAEATVISDQLNSFDQKTVINTGKNLLLLKYVNPDMGESLVATLDRLLHEENPDVANSARQALDHVKARLKATDSARAKLLSVSSALMVEQSRLTDVEVGSSHENADGRDAAAGSNDYLSEGESSLQHGSVPEAEPEAAEESADDDFGIFSAFSDPGEQLAKSDLPEIYEEQSPEFVQASDLDEGFSHSEAPASCADESDDATETDAEDGVVAWSLAPENSEDSAEVGDGFAERDELNDEETDTNEGSAPSEEELEEDVYDDFAEDSDDDDFVDKFSEDLPGDDDSDVDEDSDNDSDNDYENDYGNDINEDNDEEFENNEDGAAVGFSGGSKEATALEDTPEDYSDYMVGVPQEVPVGTEVEDKLPDEEEAPEDYSDYLIGVGGEDPGKSEEGKASAPATFDQIPEYTLAEVNPEEVKQVLTGAALISEPDADGTRQRRMELFNTLDEIEPAPDVSHEWLEYQKKAPEIRLFKDLEE